jgi:hypothetical protein
MSHQRHNNSAEDKQGDSSTKGNRALSHQSPLLCRHAEADGQHGRQKLEKE